MTFNYKEFWEHRYSTGGNSGLGSAVGHVEFKVDIINKLIRDKDISDILELGCGDGRTCSLYTGYKSYTGYDISPTIISKCQSTFSDNNTMTFVTCLDELSTFDLTLSLDVLYHIINDDDYKQYLTTLFSKTTKCVGIFSSNFYEPRITRHIQHRRVTDDIESLLGYSNFECLKNPSSVSSADFFIYHVH